MTDERPDLIPAAIPATTAAEDPIGTVRIHFHDNPKSPDARRRIAVDASDYCGPYEGCRWQRLTGVANDHLGSDPVHSDHVAGWPIQPLAEVALVLGHPKPKLPVDLAVVYGYELGQRAAAAPAVDGAPMPEPDPDAFGAAGYLLQAPAAPTVDGDLRPRIAEALRLHDHSLPRTWESEMDYYLALADGVMPLVDDHHLAAENTRLAGEADRLTRQRDEAHRHRGELLVEGERLRRELLGASRPAIPADAVVLPENWRQQVGWLFTVEDAGKWTRICRLVEMWQGKRVGTEDDTELADDLQASSKLLQNLEQAPAIPADAEEGLRLGIESWLDTENVRGMSTEDIARGAAGAAMGVLEGWSAPSVDPWTPLSSGGDSTEDEDESTYVQYGQPWQDEMDNERAVQTGSPSSDGKSQR
jgi:hypothetical protein